MTSLDTTTTTLISQEPPDRSFDEEQIAAASFLARYNGRTLEAYRDDLRGFFQRAHDHDIEVMSATRPHIELFRVSMEQRGLAAATIDRRLSTVCGFYRFAHIDGIISSNPAQYVRQPQVHPTEARGLDRSEFGVFLFTAERFDRDHAALAVLLGLNGLRVTEACETNIEVAWAGLTGTRALTPWVETWSKGWTVLLNGAMGVLVVAVAAAVSDSDSRLEARLGL